MNPNQRQRPTFVPSLLACGSLLAFLGGAAAAQEQSGVAVRSTDSASRPTDRLQSPIGLGQVLPVSLSVGWNLVAVAPHAGMPRSAAELARRIDAENSPGTVRAIRPPGAGDHPAYPQADFPLEAGRAYFVLVAATASWTHEGAATWVTGAASLEPGDSIWLATTAGSRAAEIAREIEAACGVRVRFVQRWSGTQWETYINGMPFGDFVTREGDGVIVIAGNPTR